MKRMYTPSERITFNLLDMHYDRTPNIVKINKGNTLEHELAKFLIVWELLQQDSMVVTEGIFKSGKGRADVLELSAATVYEIMNSEELARFEAKKEYYPHSLTIVGLDAKQIIKKHLGGMPCLK